MHLPSLPFSKPDSSPVEQSVALPPQRSLLKVTFKPGDPQITPLTNDQGAEEAARLKAGKKQANALMHGSLVFSEDASGNLEALFDGVVSASNADRFLTSSDKALAPLKQKKPANPFIDKKCRTGKLSQKAMINNFRLIDKYFPGWLLPPRQLLIKLSAKICWAELSIINGVTGGKENPVSRIVAKILTALPATLTATLLLSEIAHADKNGGQNG